MKARPYDIVDLIQGTPEWLQRRYDVVTASQFAALVGLCPYQKRADLLNEKLTRTEKDISDFKQVLYNRGHEAEAQGRKWIESDTGLTFPPAVLTSRTCPDLLASLDGFNTEKNVIFEAKYMGDKSLANVEDGQIKANHLVQIQAQLFVTGAKKCIYFATDCKGKSIVREVWPDPLSQVCIPKVVTKFMEQLNAARSSQ